MLDFMLDLSSDLNIVDSVFVSWRFGEGVFVGTGGGGGRFSGMRDVTMVLGGKECGILIEAAKVEPLARS